MVPVCLSENGATAKPVAAEREGVLWEERQLGVCCMHMYKRVATKLCSVYVGFSSALQWKPSTKSVGPCTSVETFNAKFVGPCTSVETFNAKFVGPCTSVEIFNAECGALHFCDNLSHRVCWVLEQYFL